MMALALDTQTIQKTQRQHTTYLLDHMVSISAALRAVREQKHCLFEQRQLLFGKRPCFSEQWQILSREESALLQELRAILAELASLREQR